MAGLGGMSGNAFGGFTRIDQLKLTAEDDSSIPFERMIFVRTIADALMNYIFFGLGRNGTSLQEFAWSYEYFYKVRSTDPTSWPKGSDPEETKLGCFDIHYQLTNLPNHYDIDRFCSMLKNHRRQIVQENFGQIISFLCHEQDKEASKAMDNVQLPLRLHACDVKRILIEPANAREVAELVYLPSIYRRHILN